MIYTFFKNLNGIAELITLFSLLIVNYLNIKYRQFFILAALVLLLYIESRAAIIALIIPFFLLINKNKKIFAFLLMVLIASLFFIKKDSSNGRKLIWKITLQQSSFSLIGKGYNSFERDYPSLQKDYFKKSSRLKEELLADDSRFAFNEFLQIYYEFGFLGITSFIVFILFQLHKGLRLKNRIYSILIFSILINSFFYYTLHETILLSVFIFCNFIILVSNFNFFDSLKNYYFTFAFLVSLFPFYSLLYNFQIDKEIEEIQMQSFQNDFSYLQEKIPAANNYYDKYRIAKLYAVTFLQKNDTASAVTIMEQLKKEYKNYDLLVFLGNLYKEKKNYELAEANLIDASFTIPNRFEPNFLLMQCFLEQKKFDSVKFYANKIILKKIKIENPRIDFYKERANEILFEMNKRDL